MIDKIRYDLYRGKKDRTLRLATLSGAKLPAHLSPKDWTLMRVEVHSDTAWDVAAKGYCFFQIVVGD
jgi:hypothetical protein